MRFTRWATLAIDWAANYAFLKASIIVAVGIMAIVVAFFMAGPGAVLIALGTQAVLLVALWYAWWQRRDRVEGILFTARYQPLPMTFRYLNEDMQDGPNHHSEWQDRPAIVALEVYVRRPTGLQNCYLTLKNAGAPQRSLLIKGSLGVNTISRHPSKTSDWFEPRFFMGDIGRSLGRVMYLLVDIRLPSDGQRLGWVIESANEPPISGDIPLKPESRVKSAWRALTKPEDVGYPH